MSARHRSGPPLTADDDRHGTINAYANHRCRCDACRDAARVYRRGRGSSYVRKTVSFLVLCRCGEPIEACDGEHGTWMHSATRRERCETGGLASPPKVNA